MSTPQFTPGPWRVLSGAILSESLNKYGNWIVVDAPLRGKIQSPESIVEDEANLRLMASAPELYAALEAAEVELEANKVAMQGPEWAAQRTATGGALLQVVRALLKARGGVS